VLSILTKKHFAISRRIHQKGWILDFEEVVNVFNICSKDFFDVFFFFFFFFAFSPKFRSTVVFGIAFKMKRPV
jgi:hypothetical protein